jgi:hypothetical protein
MWAMLLFATAGAACDADEATRATVGEQFVLESGRAATLAEGALYLKFVRVVSDSRCPEGVQCVWQGDAEIEIEARTSGGERLTLKLHTSGTPGRVQEASAFEFRVRLNALEPVPRAGVERPKSYRATLLVTRD